MTARIKNIICATRVLSENKSVKFTYETRLYSRGTETGQTPVGTVTVTVSITDVAEFSAKTLTACIVDASPSGI